MHPLKIVAVVLIVAGIAGLVYGKFSFTKATHELNVGPLDLSVKEKQTVNIPFWAGIVAIAAGGMLLIVVPHDSRARSTRSRATRNER